MQRWRGRAAWGIVLLTIGLLLFGAWGAIQSLSRPHATVTVAGAVFRVNVARTAAERARGLGGVADLAPNEGMLFVFDKDGPQPMWMKDMQISLDMVWLDSHRTVVHIEHDLAPDSYPQTFGSSVPARYVLEIPAGAATQNRIALGKTATFDLP